MGLGIAFRGLVAHWFTDDVDHYNGATWSASSQRWSPEAYGGDGNSSVTN